jgi:hypothetical protein
MLGATWWSNHVGVVRIVFGYEQEILFSFQGLTGLALTRGGVEEVLGSHLI